MLKPYSANFSIKSKIDEATRASTLLAAALAPFLQAQDGGAYLQPRFREMHLALRRDASARAADAVAELLGESPLA